jgi:hypothetical protein
MGACWPSARTYSFPRRFERPSLKPEWLRIAVYETLQGAIADGSGDVTSYWKIGSSPGLQT